MKTTIILFITFFLLLWATFYFADILNISAGYSYYDISHWYDIPYSVTSISLLVINFLLLIVSLGSDDENIN